jgi:hypothetical protein
MMMHVLVDGKTGMPIIHALEIFLLLIIGINHEIMKTGFSRGEHVCPFWR